MPTPSTSASPGDSESRWLFRLGGIAALVLFAGYLATFPVYAWVGDAPPSGVEARLAYFSRHAPGWWIILGLMVATDLLYIPVFFSLYHALKAISRSGMQLASAAMGLFVALDLALTWNSYATLIASGVKYGAATEAQRAALVAAAGSASAVLDSPLLGVYAILVPSIGYFVTGLVMRRGGFGKAAAWLALGTGATGILFMGSYAVASLGVLRIVSALLATVWYAFVGVGLLRLGRR